MSMQVKTIQQSKGRGTLLDARTEMCGRVPRKGQTKRMVLNLSSRHLSDDEYTLLGKGLSFCPKIRSHSKIKLAEELFRYMCVGYALESSFIVFDEHNENYFENVNGGQQWTAKPVCSMIGIYII